MRRAPPLRVHQLRFAPVALPYDLFFCPSVRFVALLIAAARLQWAAGSAAHFVVHGDVQCAFDSVSRSPLFCPHRGLRCLGVSIVYIYWYFVMIPIPTFSFILSLPIFLSFGVFLSV